MFKVHGEDVSVDGGTAANGTVLYNFFYFTTSEYSWKIQTALLVGLMGEFSIFIYFFNCKYRILKKHAADYI